jgi:hypothetical protein
MTIPSTQFLITEINNSPMVVNQQYTIKFYVKTISIISLSDAFVITFPSGTSISNFVAGALGGTVSFDSTLSTYYNQVLTLYLAGGPGTLDAGGIFITVPNFVAPPNTLTTDNFQLQITSNTFPRMISTQSIQVNAGTLTGSAAMSVSTVNAISSYTFTITLANPLTSSGFMILTFPTILGISNSSTAAISSTTTMNTSPTCTFSSAGNSLTITNLNVSTNSIPAQTFKLTISGVSNPPSTTTTGAFTLTTYYNGSTSAIVDTGTISGVTASPAAIDYTKIVVSSSSFTTSDATVTYYFSFMVQNPIPVGGFVVVYFPTTIVFDLGTANGNCNLMVNSSGTTTTPCTASLSSSYIFNFTNPFPSIPATIGTNLTFSILSAATNPPTTQPISPFSVFTYFSDGSSIASATNASSYSNITIPSSFTSNTISKVSNKNGEYTSFTVTLAQIANLEASAIILVVFPSSLLPQASSQCSMTYSGSNSTAACGFTSGTNTFKVINSAGVIIGGTTFSVTFTNVRNALSFAPIYGFQVTTKTALNLYFYSSSMSTNNISNTIPTQFSALTYQYSPQQLSTSISLQVNFQLSQYTLMPGSLQISIDSYFTVSNLSCTSFNDFLATCSYVTSNTLRITGTFNNSVMGFTVSGFSSPATPPSTVTYTTFASFDPSGAKIDESLNNITFSLGCTLPCQTCSTGNTSSCLSCYSNTATTSSIYFYATNSNCYTTCPATTYNNNASSPFICSTCDSNCYTCFGSGTFCTKCKPNSTYPFLNITNSSQVCIAQCVSGMYGSTAIDPPTCVACSSPCNTCNSTACLSCMTGYYFLNGTICTTNCTPLVTIANTLTNICDPCNAICRTCIGSISNCTACNDPLVFYNGSCQTGCPSGGTLASLNGVCTACTSVCQTCNGTIYNCITCNISSTYPYFYNNSCASACPIYFYNDSSVGACYSCAASNQSCVNCSSATTCLSCDTSFVLYNSKCINYVPLGYVNISSVAVACTGDCATCSVNTYNCTSCTNLSLQGYSCVSNCTAGTISVLHVCVTCNPPCQTCSGTQDTCTSCIPSTISPVFLNGIACQSSCPDYYYPNSFTYTCSSCINNCLLCSSATVCNSCKNNTFLFNTTCLPACPSGYVGINAFCQPCTTNCKTCSGGANICLSCVSGTYYINSTQTCVGSCP